MNVVVSFVGPSSLISCAAAVNRRVTLGLPERVQVVRHRVGAMSPSPRRNFDRGDRMRLAQREHPQLSTACGEDLSPLSRAWSWVRLSDGRFTEGFEDAVGPVGVAERVGPAEQRSDADEFVGRQRPTDEFVGRHGLVSHRRDVVLVHPLGIGRGAVRASPGGDLATPVARSCPAAPARSR